MILIVIGLEPSSPVRGRMRDLGANTHLARTWAESMRVPICLAPKVHNYIQSFCGDCDGIVGVIGNGDQFLRR